MYELLKCQQFPNITKKDQIKHLQLHLLPVVKEQNVTCTCVRVCIGLGILYLVCRQLKFSLFSGAVTTKALAVVVFLLLSLVSGSMEYPMPYASCLVSCSVVWRCSCSSACLDVLSLEDLWLSPCYLFNAAQLVQRFGLLQPLLSGVFFALHSWIA